MSIGDISGLVAVVIAVIGMIVAIRKSPHEIRSIDAQTDVSEANTAEKYQQIADRAAERALKLDEQIVQLQEISQRQSGEIRKMKAENSQLSKTVEFQGVEIKKLQVENDELRVWSARLTQQVIDAGGIPIPMRIPAEDCPSLTGDP